MIGTCDCGQLGPDPVFDSSASEDVCRRCGVVIETVLYDGGEWGYDDDGRDVSHVGQAGARLGTLIDPSGVSKRVLAHAGRDDANERQGEELVEACCRSLRISSSAVRDTAKDMFKIHARSKHPCGETKHAVAAMCVYYACRAERVSRELRLVSSVCTIDMRALNAAAKAVKESLNQTPYKRMISDHDAGVEALVDVFLDRLHLEPTVRKTLWSETTKRLDRARDMFDSGRKPRTIVGGLLYATALSLGVDVSKKSIMEAAGVCSQTLDKIVVIVST